MVFVNSDLYNKYVFYYDNEILNSYKILYNYFPNLTCSYEEWCLFCFKNSSVYHNKTIYPNQIKFKYLYDYYNDYFNNDSEYNENNEYSEYEINKYYDENMRYDNMGYNNIY